LGGHITASGNISASHTGSFGKMTIGTSTLVHENTQLTVAGGHGGHDFARFTRNDSGTSFVGINANALDPQIRFYEGSDYAAIGVDATNSNLVFATGSKVNGKEAMVIDTDGKVGIGTTTPTVALQVTGDISASGDLILGDIAGGNYVSASATGGNLEFTGAMSGSATSTFTIGGKLQAGSKSFLIPRPEGGKLEYGALEGQQNDVFFRGELKGDNVIYLPKEWEWLVDENTITTQLTSIGKHQELYVKEIKDNKIFIGINGMFKTKENIHCYHIVHGTRKDVELIRNYQ